MFYGIEVKSSQNKAETITLKNSIKLTQAVLEPSKNGKKEPVSLMVEYDKKQFILCVLDPSLSWQCPLDLVFSTDSSLKFFIKGTGTVHLTGYETFDDLDDLPMSISDYSDDEYADNNQSSDDGELKEEAKTVNTSRMMKVSGKKTLNSSKTNGVKIPVKRNTEQEINNDDDSEDDSDDDDFDVNDELDHSSDEDLDEEVDIDDEDGDDDDEEEEEEDGDDDDDDDDEMDDDSDE